MGSPASTHQPLIVDQATTIDRRRCSSQSPLHRKRAQTTRRKIQNNMRPCNPVIHESKEPSRITNQATNSGKSSRSSTDPSIPSIGPETTPNWPENRGHAVQKFLSPFQSSQVHSKNQSTVISYGSQAEWQASKFSRPPAMTRSTASSKTYLQRKLPDQKTRRSSQQRRTFTREDKRVSESISISSKKTRGLSGIIRRETFAGKTIEPKSTDLPSFTVLLPLKTAVKLAGEARAISGHHEEQQAIK
nr:hypothetical protein Iba_chr03fCG0010 [Ipomoea batatas]